MMRFVLVLLIIVLPFNAFARPVSYPGGWTIMLKNDVDVNSTHIHYTIDPQNSVGWRHEYHRENSVHTNFVQHNRLLKRWNAPNAQANLYLKSGVGVAYNNDDETNPAAFTGVAADWEDRRYFVSYSNRFFTAGNLERFAEHKSRFGIAPYIGDYGDLHTWLMLEANYNPSQQDNFSMTPLVRFFKGATMVEGGYNFDDGVLFNFIQRF